MTTKTPAAPKTTPRKRAASPKIDPATKAAAGKATARKRAAKPKAAKPTPAKVAEARILSGDNLESYVKSALTRAGVKVEDLSPEALERAVTSPVKHGGLRGKALAAWIVDGLTVSEQIQNGRKDAALAGKGKRATADLGVEPADLLRDYLVNEASVKDTAPNDAKPWVTEDGRVYLHSSWLVGYLEAKNGGEVEKRAVTAALGSLGLTVRAYPIPGEGRSLGLWQGIVAPELVDGIGRRESKRSNGPGARIPANATHRIAVSGDGVRGGLSTWLAKGEHGDVTITVQNRDLEVVASITVAKDGSIR